PAAPRRHPNSRADDLSAPRCSRAEDSMNSPAATTRDPPALGGRAERASPPADGSRPPARPEASSSAALSPTDVEPAVVVEDVHVAFEEKTVLDGISFRVRRGDTVVIL